MGGGKRGRTKPPSGRLALKKARVAAKPVAASVVEDTSEAEIGRVREMLSSAANGDALEGFSRIAAQVGVQRALLGARTAPRVILHMLAHGRGAGDASAIARSIVTIACARGDDEAAQRARAWGARVITAAVKGKGAFAHACTKRHVAAVAPRDSLDSGAVRALAARVSQSLDGGECGVGKAAEMLVPVVDMMGVRQAVEALLLAALRIPAFVGEGEDEVLPEAFVNAVMIGPFLQLGVKARGALLVTCERVREESIADVIHSIETRPFLPLDEEEAMCAPLGVAAALDPHIHWALLERAVEAARVNEMAMQDKHAWKGRRAYRALLTAAAQACEDASVPSLAYRLPRRARSLVGSLVALSCSEARITGSEYLRTVLQRKDMDEALLAAEHSIELIAMGTRAECKWIRATVIAGKVGRGEKFSMEIVKKEARDGAAGAELVRALMMVRKYKKWADRDTLIPFAMALLQECRHVHRRDVALCHDIEESMRCWSNSS